MATGEHTAVTIAKGSVRRPASNGPYPFTAWKNWVIRKMNPNSEKNATATIPAAVANLRLANSATSRIGCATTSSRQTKSPITAIATTIPTMVRASVHP